MVLYYLLILLIPFNTHPFWSQNIMMQGLTPIKIVGIAALIYAFIYGSGKRIYGRRGQRQYKWLLFLLLWVSLSSFVNGLSFHMVYMRLFSMISFFFITILLVDSKEKVRKSLVVAVLSMCIATAYTVRDYIIYTIPYGWRPPGSFGDSNYYALSAVSMVPVAFYLWKHDHTKWIRLFGLAAFSFITLGIALTLSRGGLLALFVALFLLIVDRKGLAKGLVVGSIVLVILSVVIVPEATWQRFKGVVTFMDDDPEGPKEVSFNHRLMLLKSGKEMVKANPFFGIGLGNFKPLSVYYLPELSSPGIAHNSFMEVAAETGLPALFAFIIILASVVKDLKRLERRLNDYTGILCKGMRIGFIAMIVAAFFLSAQYEKMLWLLIDLTIAIKRFAFSKEKVLEGRLVGKEVYNNGECRISVIP